MFDDDITLSLCNTDWIKQSNSLFEVDLVGHWRIHYLSLMMEHLLILIMSLRLMCCSQEIDALITNQPWIGMGLTI